MRQKSGPTETAEQHVRDIRLATRKKYSAEEKIRREIIRAWVVGWGARIRTWDAGTKNRCLTAWRRPTMAWAPSRLGWAVRTRGTIPRQFDPRNPWIGEFLGGLDGSKNRAGGE